MRQFTKKELQAESLRLKEARRVFSSEKSTAMGKGQKYYNAWVAEATPKLRSTTFYHDSANNNTDTDELFIT